MRRGARYRGRTPDRRAVRRIGRVGFLVLVLGVMLACGPLPDASTEPPDPERAATRPVVRSVTERPGMAPTATPAAVASAVTHAPAGATRGATSTPTPTPGSDYVEPPRIVTIQSDTLPPPEPLPTACLPLFAHAVRWLRDDFVEWSADGSVILFSRGPLLYAATPDGTRAWQVADASSGPDSSEAVGPLIPFDLSPDGAEVVYATCQFPKREGVRSPPETAFAYELAVRQLDGTGERRLTRNGRFDGLPAWSPDGEWIAFWDEALLVLIPADGTGRARWSKPFSDPVRHAPVWAPDGRSLAVAHVLGEGGVAIDVLDVDGNRRARLTERAASAASWSPDGARLAFVQHDGLWLALYTIAADGSDARRLAPVTEWFPASHTHRPPPAWWIPRVAWSPDGSRILLVVQPGRLWSADLASAPSGPSAVVVVTVGGVEQGRMELLAPDYAPNWGRRDAAWSPDGSRIVVVALWRELSHWYGPTGTVSVFTVAADGSDPQTVAGRGYGRRLLARHARQPYNPADLRICRGNASVNASLNPGLVNDCAALLALHEDLPDAVELNWTRERPLREWDGVTIGGSPPRIRELRLTGVRLDRRAARSLIWLTDLRVLDLSRSEVGSIWSELGELRNLEELRLAGADAQGGIPAELGQLTNLRVLDLSFNELTESIPADLGQLVNLRVLDLSWNELTESIPAELGQLTNLTHLNLSSNGLKGPIPAELGQLTNLTDLNLSSNGLNGAIPAELSQLGELREVRLAWNRWTGCLPSKLPVVHREQLRLPECKAAA